jgi:hypothetical protein
MKGLATTMPDAHYKLNLVTADEEQKNFVYFATFYGTHTGTGGPVEATGRSMQSQYAYVISLNADGKVSNVTKLWNNIAAFKQLGWA